ncbi:UNVERIFIED_CONTAM: hypothetical protein Sindi_0546000, partial [Sesamum indicum]
MESNVGSPSPFCKGCHQWFNQLLAGVSGNFKNFDLCSYISSLITEALQDKAQSFCDPLEGRGVPKGLYPQIPHSCLGELLDEDFFKFLAKKPASRFDGLLTWAKNYINIEDAQASKRGGCNKKRKESKEEIPPRKQGRNYESRSHHFKEEPC